MPKWPHSIGSDTDLEPAAAQLVKHADLFECAQWMIEVEQQDKRTNAQSQGALRDA
ncbi:hypothetical protein ABIB82_006678 [Bradyrhizobium sp. i1.8.4]